MGGLLYIWHSEEGTGRAAAPPSSLLAVPNVTVHPSTASVPITVLPYDGPLLCGFNVAIKGLTCGNAVNIGKWLMLSLWTDIRRWGWWHVWRGCQRSWTRCTDSSRSLPAERRWWPAPDRTRRPASKIGRSAAGPVWSSWLAVLDYATNSPHLQHAGTSLIATNSRIITANYHKIHLYSKKEQQTRKQTIKATTNKH